MPYNISTSNIEYYYPHNKTKEEFYFIYNKYEYFGHGFCDVYDQSSFQQTSYNCKKNSIETIIGYYYNKSFLYILCKDIYGREIWVRPKIVGNDLIFFRSQQPNEEKMRTLSYIRVK